ncbi:MAG: glutamate synthase subunit alpha, partial [Chloroflexi bacterium]|nr:glutamate synthase subunit alpha [Chloroflexota bacterium]
MNRPEDQPYQPQFDRGNCGIGFVADQYGRASHEILQLGIETLINLQHRGALNADARTGDGAGILTPLPRHLFVREAQRLTGRSIAPDQIAVGVFFLDPHVADQCITILEATLHEYELSLVTWRELPLDPDTLGAQARLMMPRILQAIITTQSPLDARRFELQLYLARKHFERRTHAAKLSAYVPSMSSRTIVYKGLLLAPQLPAFYLDLADPDFTVSIVVVHQRYSTNTFPTWQRAQPFRMVCHNGEINTLQGNLAWMKAREPQLDLAGFEATSTGLTSDQNLRGLLRPVIDTNGSDSAMLDNAVELLLRGGRDLPHAITMLVPPAWEKTPELSPAVRDFYQYHAAISEPWDGPAALVFTDGQIVGASLDRNGLRPCRYFVTDDGLIGAASEAGAVPTGERTIIRKGKLGPGQLFVVDTARGVYIEDHAVKSELAARKPYGTWLKQNLRRLTVDEGRTTEETAVTRHSSLVTEQASFGYTHEELTVVLRPMVENKAEAIGSMGDDTPSAVLSEKPRPLFGYFRQRFAEVTNPAIDPLREELVMSLRVKLGSRRNFLAETPDHARLLELATPFLTDEDFATLINDVELKAATLSTLIPIVGAGLAPAQEGDRKDTPLPQGDREGAPLPTIDLPAAIAQLCDRAVAAVQAGAQLLVLSDRGIDQSHTFIPALLALGAVHHHLLRADARTQVDLIVDSGEPREVHHFATLIGYGAAAIHPYLALATARTLGRDVKADEAVHNYLHAAEHGLLKIMSKMGISTVDAYCGAQIFETIGLSATVVDKHFAGTPSHLGGIGLEAIAQIVLSWHAAAYAGEAELPSPGFYKFKRDGERHAYSPAVVQALHNAVKTPGALNGSWRTGYAAYLKYSELQHAREPIDVRDFVEYRTTHQPVSLELVESAHSILWRFSTAAMSHGAISAEAHETLSIAMNRLGGSSNSGEGGEDPLRYHSDSNDRIKQVASGRFGVTPAYLISADELQIKIAQGSKPGEGGQLPGHKVTAEIAAIRHSTPGVTLISPPPHHDIYSIEDLAQLIYDLRQINPGATISVKLVAQAGIGTIAAGVAKAGADVILISGNSGGTGASPLSSIKYAGIPWELGLAEAQYVLVTSGLRGRVRLRADGGLRTGRDVVKAILLGADEFSFGTAAVVAEGCKMARACHLNTCPVGIATQKPELRAKFDGQPEHVMAFMVYVAQEVREILANLGLKTVDAAIGRVDLLHPNDQALPRDTQLDLKRLLLVPPYDQPRRFMGERNTVSSDSPLNDRLLNDAWNKPDRSRPLDYEINNRDRTFGAKLAQAIIQRCGEAGVADQPIEVTLRGSAGQSFGAFSVPGMHLTLTGEANDYVGKGMAG